MGIRWGREPRFHASLYRAYSFHRESTQTLSTSLVRRFLRCLKSHFQAFSTILGKLLRRSLISGRSSGSSRTQASSPHIAA